MATLWIREYSRVAHPRYWSGDQVPGSLAPMAVEPGTDQTPVTFSTTTPSAAFGASTQYIAIVASAAFHYVVGSAPVATTGALKIPADTPIYIGVKPGDKIAAIAAA